MAIAKKKKRFFEVEMPIINKETHLQAIEIEELDGKFIKYDLTRILRGKSMLLGLKVEVKDGKAIAVPREILLLPYFLRRMVRKGTDYVEDSFSLESKDSVIRIKPLLVTRRRVSRVVRKALREKVKEELTNILKKRSTNQIFEDLLKNSLQKELSLKLKKVYPLSLCEIKSFKVEKTLESKEEAVEETKAEEKEVEKKVSKKKTSAKKEAKNDESDKE